MLYPIYDPIYDHCLKMGIKITRAPTDSGGVREMHIHHLDGHTFRISQLPQ